jgi:hypothetical protein
MAPGMSPNVKPDIIVTPSAFSAPTVTLYGYDTALRTKVGASGYPLITPQFLLPVKLPRTCKLYLKQVFLLCM